MQIWNQAFIRKHSGTILNLLSFDSFEYLSPCPRGLEVKVGYIFNCFVIVESSVLEQHALF